MQYAFTIARISTRTPTRIRVPILAFYGAHRTSAHRGRYLATSDSPDHKGGHADDLGGPTTRQSTTPDIDSVTGSDGTVVTAQRDASRHLEPSVPPEGRVFRKTRVGKPRPKRLPHHFVDHEAKGAEAAARAKQQLREGFQVTLTIEDVQMMPLQVLFDVLKESAMGGQFDKVYELVNNLVEHRSVAPNYDMYHALILANASNMGSVDRVMHCLDEMEAERIPLDQTLCNAIVRVLAVHPDHILRTEILQYLERRWFNLSSATHLLFIASLFRGLQLEQGLQELQLMRSNNLPVDEWLYTLAISVLIEVREFDEAMKVMRIRLEDVGNARATALWTHLLDSAAQAHHYLTCRYIWLRCVKAEYINVSSGTCSLLLTLAARHGDVDFAVDIIRVIKRHHFGIDRHHWELLVETYANAGMLERAIASLVDMELAQSRAEQFTTRPIFMALKAMPEHQRDDTCLELYDHLLNRHAMLGRVVPIAAVNVLIESCVYAQSAYDMYHNIRLVCRHGPNSGTFHYLLAHTAHQKDATRALQYAKEHQLMGLKPDQVVYDGLLMTLVAANHDIEDTMAIYDEMRAVRDFPIFRTAAALYKALRVHNHPRAPEVFAQIHRREDKQDPGELSVRLQKLRMEAAAAVANAKNHRPDIDDGQVLVPPAKDNLYQVAVADLKHKIHFGGRPELVRLQG